MSERINLNTNNTQAVRFVNSRTLINKSETVNTNVLNNIQQTSIRNTSEFITQSAKSLYRFFADMQSGQMRNSELSLILKDLLSMQKDMESFLANISNSKNLGSILQQMTKPDIAKLLMNSQMDLSKLMLFMQQNGKEALSKLFNMTADFAQSGAVPRSSQISEIIAILNACTPTSDASQSQVIKNMMLLYLPWLPLGEQNFSIEINSKTDNENEADGEDSISILISTINFGNVKVLIFKSDKSTINFNIYAGENFPKEKILETLKAEAKEYNIQTTMTFEKQKVQDNQLVSENIETKVSVNTSRHINPFLILMAQSSVRIIISFDKSMSLDDIRKSKL
ncbi:hypothetical protein IJG14_01895 [bacterium]|nr:hypothetical protein [bacterium]